ncbi:UDP-glycosyltransferase 85C1-like protein [Tanacetum coccineum]
MVVKVEVEQLIGSCILQVWNHGSALQPCKCPLCRRQITLLVPSEASSQQAHNSEASEILKKIEAYNRLFGSQSAGLAQRMQDLPFLLKRLFRELMDPQRSLPFVIKARVYLAAKVLSEKGLVPLKDESYLTNGYTDTLIDWIPGMEKIRLRDIPELILATKPDDLELKWLVDTARRADSVSHMIVHSFDELEATLIKELKSIFPNVYAIGPLQLHLNQITEKETVHSNFNSYSLWKEEPECIQWLQSKEANSVVYVNFGSLAVMSLQDLLELGWGLVNSNHYFLWIIRTDLVDGKPAVLPEELEEVVKGKGFIASWCSQEEVLNHPSVGGFLTHGGWGSVIESLSAGVPMVCWPFSHDQRINCRQMCKEWEIGMEIEGSLKRDVVEKLVRELMEGLEGKRIRKNTMEWKKTAENTTSPNGSSSLTIDKLTNEITIYSKRIESLERSKEKAIGQGEAGLRKVFILSLSGDSFNVDDKLKSRVNIAAQK